MFWSKKNQSSDNIVQILEEITLSYGTRSNKFIKQKINKIIEIILLRCIEESIYGNSTVSISIDEIKNEYNKEAKIDDIRMLESILEKIPNRLKRWIKSKINKTELKTSWNNDILFIRWYDDIQIDDQGQIIVSDDNNNLFD